MKPFEIESVDFDVPGKPTNLQAVAGDGYINLFWNLPESEGGFPITNFIIYKSTNSGDEIYHAKIGNQLFYNDTIVTNDLTYYYQISAVNAIGEGPLSNEVNATPQGTIIPFTGTILYVGGSGPGNYTRIQDAIDNASYGNTVFVFDYSSPYYENIIINKSINLVGENRETTIIDGRELGNIVFINQSYASITNFTIINSKDDFDAGDLITKNGIFLYEAQYCRIYNNNINSYLYSGISLYGNKNIIENNNISVIVFGIIIDSSRNNIRNNTIISTGTGIRIVKKLFSYNNVSNNMINNCRSGIALGSSYNHILDNFINNSNYGCSISYDSNYNYISGNTFSNSNIGMNIYESKKNNVINNVFSNNNISIDIDWDSQDNIIKKNNISNSKIGIVLNSSLRIKVFHNNFINNVIQALDYTDSNLWNETYPTGGNYWSDYNGTDANGDGIGDAPYIIDEDSQDNYPLMEPWDIEIEEPLNIDITLELDKTEFYLGENITGSVHIRNNNPFKVYLNDELFQVMSGSINPEDLGAFFRVNSLDYHYEFELFVNYPTQIIVEAKSSLVLDFILNQFTEVIFTTWQSRENNFIAGNYTIYTYFNNGTFPIYDKIYSNTVNFKIVVETSPPAGGNGGDGGSGSGSDDLSTTIVFASATGLVLLIIILALFAAATEIGTYKFASMFAAPLYSRELKKRKRKGKELYLRGKIHGYILGNPGENYTTIKTKLSLTNGALAYHLKVLERNKDVRSERDGVLKRFYPYEGKVTEEILELSKLQKRILNVIKKDPGVTQTKISKKLDISVQKVNYHIRLMEDARVIRLERDRNKTKCYVVD
jgi:parallel beta-helix repeat protein